MPDDLLSRLQPTNRVLKRAQYEAFAFSLFEGDVLVRNESHANPAAHEYRVRIEGGVPTTCECPADANFSGPCKHRVAVAIRSRILAAAETMQLVADGGTRPKPSDSSETATDSEDCACDSLPADFPCWPCVRTGRRVLPGRDRE